MLSRLGYHVFRVDQCGGVDVDPDGACGVITRADVDRTLGARASAPPDEQRIPITGVRNSLRCRCRGPTFEPQVCSLTRRPPSRCRVGRPIADGRRRRGCGRRWAGGAADYGEVRWDAVVTNQDDAPVATYDVLTLVAKLPQDH